MHFSIPETVQATDDNGSKYWNFHIHVNGVYHCKLRYSQLDKFYEQLRNEFPDRTPTKLFPGKKLFALTADQLQERREQLEKFIQHISQDPVIGISDQFNDFFLKAQQNGREVESKEVTLDIYLMNGNKVTICVSSIDQTDDVLETAMKKIGLAEKYFYYFALFLVERGSDGGINVVRKLQDFESPYLSLEAVDTPHRIVIRKNYWNPKYDDDLLEDRIAMNLLYVQITDDMDRGWMLCTDENKAKIEKLQGKGSRKEVLRLARTFKFYGYTHYQPCTADYPSEDSVVMMASGDREFNIRVRTDEDKMLEGSFKVQRIRSWRLTSLPYADKSNESTKESLQFAFEYLFGKTDLRWITIQSNQAIMMSMAMQGMVDEILREQQGKGIRTPKPKNSKKRTLSTSSDGGKSAPTPADASNEENTKKQEKARKVRQNKKNAGVNEVFAEDIGDDDL
ncbi:sorting nexin-17-like isoform X2 [Hydractinia symbiolongicarpus]|uniref:sorting nexin-17-like isoform X2 n=1 Tax=Hydractinia symbiolongicarpus TaxID=13093 RepID=UPI00254C4AB6|nr:sorting nexin-17-like isoform X2 [Hydractinia symbiolongicarpus]